MPCSSEATLRFWCLVTDTAAVSQVIYPRFDLQRFGPDPKFLKSTKMERNPVGNP